MATTTVTKSSGSPTGHHSSLRVEPYLSEEKPVHSAISFLVRDPKHDQEKPYEITYDPEGVIPARNTEHEPHLVHIVNFRPIADEKSFETFGFSAEKVECDLTPDEYTDRGRVESVYYKVAEKLLREKFPDAALIKILEHNVCKIQGIVIVSLFSSSGRFARDILHSRRRMRMRSTSSLSLLF